MTLFRNLALSYSQFVVSVTQTVVTLMLLTLIKVAGCSGTIMEHIPTNVQPERKTPLCTVVYTLLDYRGNEEHSNFIDK